MLTYQDLLQVADKGEAERMAFVRKAISNHKATEEYKTAEIADLYNKHRNVTINNYRKWLYKITGEAVEDKWSANYKIGSRFFHRFVLQQAQFLLGNGISFNNETTVKKLENKRYKFDNQVVKAAKSALIMGVSFGFYNLDHVEVFDLLEFVPLYDEENGSLSAGIRFWQIDETKPLRATLYELDGYTEYIWNVKVKDSGITEENGAVLKEKRKYILKLATSEADGTEIYDGENYPTFPIVPLWGNPEHQSEIVGLREQIDCYDLIKSGFADTVDDASLIYWTIQNADGMDDVDLAKFVERMKIVKASVIDDDGARAESHAIDVPYASREALLDRLRRDIYEDAMALDTKSISAGAATATEIVAAYEPLNSKTDEFEYCVIDFIQGILNIAGVEDEPTFTRSMNVNVSEMVQVVLQSAQYFTEDYVTSKLLELLGDKDKIEDMLKEISANEMERMIKFEPEEETEEEEQVEVSEETGNSGSNPV